MRRWLQAQTDVGEINMRDEKENKKSSTAR